MANDHILSSFNPLSKIQTFMKKTTKVQYGCVEISSSFICIGASTGTTYMFDRQTSELKHFITNKASAIVHLKFSSDGKILAVADSSGLITLWEIPFEIHSGDHLIHSGDHLNQEIKVFREIKELVGEKISELCWHENLKLFIGTQSGTVASFNVGSNVFVSKFEILMKSGSHIVQLDVSSGNLLISSTTKALIYSLDSGQFCQIGKKARTGLYGCCFLNNSEVIIYSARPGSRLWEVDTSGQVLSTHQFKELLNIPPTPIITSSAVKLSESNCSSTSRLSFNFPYLYQVMNKYLLTWSADGIFLFEPHKRKVFAWNDQIKDVISMTSFGSSIFVLHSQCIVTEIQLLSLKDFLKTFHDLEEWEKVAEVACKCKEKILQNVETFISIDFYKAQSQLEMEKLPSKFLQEFQNFVKDFEQKHVQICTEIEKKMNQNISECNQEDYSDIQSTNDDIQSTNDDIQSTKSTNDDILSTKSSNSRISTSKFDSFMEKATNKIVKKVVASGFMKKVIYDALENEGVHINKSLHENIKKTKSVPSSPTQSRSNISESSIKYKEKTLNKMYNQLPEHHSMPNIFSNTDTNDIVYHRMQKKSKKKKSSQNCNKRSTDFTDSSSTENTSSETSMNLSSESVTCDTGESINGNFITPSFRFEIETEPPVFLLKLPNNYFQIISKLLSVTANTSNNFRDTKILYNINNVKKVLNHWSKELSSVTVEFQEEVFKLLNESIKNALSDIILSFIDIESRFLLFKQLSAGYSEISNVAMLCLQTSIFPEKCKMPHNYEFALLSFALDFDTMRKSAQQEAKEIINKKNDLIDSEMADENQKNAVLKEISSTDIRSTMNMPYESLCLRMLVSSGNDSAFEKKCFFGENKDNENISLCEGFSSDNMTECVSCILDKCRACFILRYFPILNFERMYSLLLWKGGCRWRSWCACMVHLKELYKHSNLSKAIAKNQLSVEELLSSTVEDFLGNISRLYIVAPHLVSLYIKEGQFTNWEVSLLYNTGYLKDASNDFLLYAENAFLSLSMHKLHPLFLLCCLTNSLNSQPSTLDLFCTCGKPRPRANSIEWKYQKILVSLFDYLEELKKDTQTFLLLQGMSNLCLKRGYWTGCIKLLVWLNKINDAVTLLVQLQDEEIFIWVTKSGCLNLDLWSNLLYECSNQSDVEKHNCEVLDGLHSTLNLDKVVRSAAIEIGCFAVLEIINKFCISVSLDLHTSLLQALSHENQQKIVVEKILQVANDKVWTDKINNVHSKLENVKNKELIGIESMFTGEFTADFIINESDSMWGRNINLSDTTCPLCTLPLCIKTSSTLNGGLILFPCGHIFHKICLPELACLICFYKRFTSLS